MTRGGKRPGAGRPPAETKQVRAMFTLLPDDFERARLAAAAVGKSFSDYVRSVVLKSLKTRKTTQD